MFETCWKLLLQLVIVDQLRVLLLVIYYRSLSHKIFEVAAFQLYFRVLQYALHILLILLPI